VNKSGGDKMNITVLKGNLAAAFTITVWSVTYIIGKILLEAFTPAEIFIYRFIIAIAFLYIIEPHLLKIKSIKEEIMLAFAGLVGISVYFILQNFSLKYTTASNVSVITSTSPLFTGILSRIFLGDKKSTGIKFYISFVVAMIGVALISFNGSAVELHLFGDMLIFLATVLATSYSILVTKLFEKGYGVIQVTRRTFIYGVVFSIPFLKLLGFEFGFERFANKIYAASILFLGLVASALCYISLNYATKVIGAVKTNTYMYAQSVLTVIAAYFILHERLTIISLVGIIMVLTGLIISGNKFKNEGKETIKL
jgi:drug/metabolite transporter (DMT)-like permease